MSDRLAADTEIDEAVAQYLGNHFSNRLILAVKAKTGQRPGFTELYHVAMLELSGGNANTVHPYRPALESLDFISVFSAVKTCDQVVPWFVRARFRDAEEPVGPQGYIQVRTAEPCHRAPAEAGQVL
jgi:hypothetical protein